jgi:hypothetical protein
VIINPFVYPETAIPAYRNGSPTTQPHLTSPPKKRPDVKSKMTEMKKIELVFWNKV